MTKLNEIQVTDRSSEIMSRTEATAYLGYPRGRLASMGDALNFKKVGSARVYYKKHLDELKSEYIWANEFVKHPLPSDCLINVLESTPAWEYSDDALYRKKDVRRIIIDYVKNMFEKVH